MSAFLVRSIQHLFIEDHDIQLSALSGFKSEPSTFTVRFSQCEVNWYGTIMTAVEITCSLPIPKVVTALIASVFVLFFTVVFLFLEKCF